MKYSGMTDLSIELIISLLLAPNDNIFESDHIPKSFSRLLTIAEVSRIIYSIISFFHKKNGSMKESVAILNFHQT